MLWEHEPQASVSRTFSSFSKLTRVFLYKIDRNTEYMFCISLSRKTPRQEKGNQLFNSDYQNVNFSLLAPSLPQQRALVLCHHRVIQTRFLINQRPCFLMTVF